MKNNVLVVVGIIVLAALGGWYYLSNRTTLYSPTPATNTDATAGTQTPPESSVGGTPSGAPSGTTMETGTVREFTVVGSSFTFSPSTLSVKKGDHVKITFVNSGGMHDFVLNDFNAATPVIQTGQSAVVEFDADKTGSFQYYCSVGNHRAMGMVGTLTVE